MFWKVRTLDALVLVTKPACRTSAALPNTLGCFQESGVLDVGQIDEWAFHSAVALCLTVAVFAESHYTCLGENRANIARLAPGCRQPSAVVCGRLADYFAEDPIKMRQGLETDLKGDFADAQVLI